MWHLEEQAHEVFPRNPLVSVVCQLRFHPILKVADQIADFQEGVRGEFPVFHELTQEVLSVLAPIGTQVQVQKEHQFRFQTEEGSATLTLTRNSLAIEDSQHRSSEWLFKNIQSASDILGRLYRPVRPTRLGLRYINIVDRGRISQDLARDVQWTDLVRQPILDVIPGRVDLEGTSFFSEIRSPVEGSEGEMTLRRGLVKEQDDSIRFRFDIDRYIDGSFELPSVPGRLQGFGEEIYSLFIAAAGPGLLEWMKGR